MKPLFAALGAGFIAAAMLATPADAAPRCAWKGTFWQCWNGHSWYRDHNRRAEFRQDWRHERRFGHELRRDMYYGSSARHDWRQDRRDWRYGR